MDDAQELARMRLRRKYPDFGLQIQENYPAIESEEHFPLAPEDVPGAERDLARRKAALMEEGDGTSAGPLPGIKKRSDRSPAELVFGDDGKVAGEWHEPETFSAIDDGSEDDQPAIAPQQGKEAQMLLAKAMGQSIDHEQPEDLFDKVTPDMVRAMRQLGMSRTANGIDEALASGDEKKLKAALDDYGLDPDTLKDDLSFQLETRIHPRGPGDMYEGMSAANQAEKKRALDRISGVTADDASPVDSELSDIAAARLSAKKGDRTRSSGGYAGYVVKGKTKDGRKIVELIK